MPYTELVKNFNRVRDYMREFYVYGFKGRDEYTRKSARSYDDERRRLESWLGDYMRFRQRADGKTVFLSIDSRARRHNPLYAGWKAKSFTDGDITLHFLIFDILHEPGISMTLNELTQAIDQRLAAFSEPMTFDQSTLRKKLREYEREGIITSTKAGRAVRYSRAADAPLPGTDALHFFSEAAPCGVVGSFILDKLPACDSLFAFKHHYITGAMDSQVLCDLFAAMGERRYVTIQVAARRRESPSEFLVVPLRIMISAQNGRSHLMAYVPRFGRVTSFRTDGIVTVTTGDVCPRFDALRAQLDAMQPHLWGVSTQSQSGQRLEHVSFTVTYADDEAHIHRRLERERRCGAVTRLDAHTTRFDADVYDAHELVPWMRTFTCRITHFECSDKQLEAQFVSDIRQMYAMYGIDGGDDS